MSDVKPPVAAPAATPATPVVAPAPAAAPQAKVTATPVMTKPAEAAKAELAIKKANNAAAAVKAMREAQAAAALTKSGAAPVHKDGAPGAPSAEVDHAKLAAQAAAANPTTPPAQPGSTPTAQTVAAPQASSPAQPAATPVAPSGTPSSTPPSSQAPQSPQDRSWASLHAAELKLMEERKKLVADAQRQKELEEKAARADQLERELREAGPSVLERYNWSREAQARAILAATQSTRNGGTQATGTGPSSAPLQQSPATAQGRGFVPLTQSSGSTGTSAPDPEKAALIERLGQLEGFILAQQVRETLAKPEFEIVRGEPGASERVLREMNKHYELTGKPLTFDEAAARVQDELVTAVKSRAADPRFAKVLGLNGSSAAASAPQAASEANVATPGGDEEPTTLTSSLAPAAPMSVVDRIRSERSRHDRVAAAVRAARQSQVR